MPTLVPVFHPVIKGWMMTVGTGVTRRLSPSFLFDRRQHAFDDQVQLLLEQTVCVGIWNR